MKAELRRAMRALLDAHPAQESEGPALADQLLNLLPPPASHLQPLLAFHSFGREVPTRPFLEMWLAGGGRLALPRVDADGVTLALHLVAGLGELAAGYRGLLEPAPSAPRVAPGELCAAVVPGLAFDAAGGRLGHGGGHYDRLLARLPQGCLRIAACRDLQLVDAVPMLAHDQRVDAIATPTRTIKVRRD